MISDGLLFRNDFRHTLNKIFTPSKLTVTLEIFIGWVKFCQQTVRYECADLLSSE